MIVSYNEDFDVRRLEHMRVTMYQGRSVLACYPDKPWEVETVGELVPPVAQAIAVPKAKPVFRPLIITFYQHGRIAKNQPWRNLHTKLGGGFKHFSIFTPIPGKMIQFDDHIF